MYSKLFFSGVFLMSLCVQSSAQVKKHITEGTHDLQEVVVTGTGTSHLLKNTPVLTEVITRKMLDSYGGKSIEEILGGLTSSFSFNEGDMGSQTQLNGLGNNYILILIDGKRIHGDVGGENDLGLIDPQNIEKIEIVKGAQSALYGSDAMAGVINIITKRSKILSSLDKEKGIYLDESTRLESGGGLKYDIRQHNSVGLKYRNLQSYTNFQYQYNDGWQNTSDAYTEGKLVHDAKRRTVNKYNNFQIGERLAYTPSKNVELYLEGTYYNKTINRLDPEKESVKWVCDKYTFDLHYRNASASAGGRWKLNKTDFLTFDFDWNKHAYYYKYTAKTYEDAYVDGELESVPMYRGQKRLQSDQQRLMANIKGVFQLPYNNLLSTGAEYRYDYLNAPMRVEGGTANDWTAALYVQDEYDIMKCLNLTAGIRFIENAAFGFEVTPKVSTMISLGDVRLRIGYSRGFKSPTTKELNYHYLHQMGTTMFYYMGNKDLKAQTSDYVSAGAEYRGEKLTVSVTGYYNKLANMITLVNISEKDIPVGSLSHFMGDGSTSITPRKYMNMESANTSGVDVNVTYSINKEWSVGGNYSYLNTDAKVYDTGKGKLVSVVIDGMAYNKWNAFATWNHRFSDMYKLSCGLHTRGSSKRFYQTNGDGKAFQIWRLTTSHDFGKSDKPTTYRVELGVDNIFNYIDRTPYDYHLGTTSHGTSVYCTFAMKFNHGKKVTTTIKKKSSRDEEGE